MTRRHLLYVFLSLSAVQVGDVWSTALAAANGGVETNPAMVKFILLPIWFQLLTKALIFPAVGVYLLDVGRWFTVRRTGAPPSLCYLIPLGFLLTGYTYVILNNLRVADIL